MSEIRGWRLRGGMPATHRRGRISPPRNGLTAPHSPRMSRIDRVSVGTKAPRLPAITLIAVLGPVRGHVPVGLLKRFPSPAGRGPTAGVDRTARGVEHRPTRPQALLGRSNHFGGSRPAFGRPDPAALFASREVRGVVRRSPPPCGLPGRRARGPAARRDIRRSVARPPMG